MTNNKTMVFKKDNTGKDIIPFNVLNHNEVTRQHFEVQNAEIGDVAVEVEVVSFLRNESAPVIKSVLTDVFNQDGTGVNEAFEGLESVDAGDGHTAYPLTTAGITSNLKSLKEVAFKKTSHEHNLMVIDAVEILKNGEGQTVIDGAKKFLEIEQVINFKDSARIKGRDKVDARLVFPHEEVNLALYNGAKKETVRKSRKLEHYLSENRTLITNLDRSKVTEKVGRITYMQDGFKDIRDNEMLVLEDLSGSIVLNHYNSVGYNQDQRSLLTITAKNHNAEYKAMGYFKGLFGILFSVIIFNKELITSNTDELSSDGETTKAALSDSQNEQIGYIRDMVRAIMPNLSYEVRGLLAFLASKEKGKLSTRGTTFAITALPEEAIVAAQTLVNGSVGFYGQPIVLAAEESIKEGEVVVIKNRVEIEGMESKLAYGLEDGEWTVRVHNGRTYASRNTVDAFEAKASGRKAVALMAEVGEISATVEREFGKVVSVDYGEGEEIFSKLVNDIQGKEVIVASSKVHGHSILVDADGELKQAVEIRELKSDLVLNYVHSSVIKVTEVVRGVVGGEMKVIIFGEYVRDFPSADLPLLGKSNKTVKQQQAGSQVVRIKQGASLLDFAFNPGNALLDMQEVDTEEEIEEEIEMEEEEIKPVIVTETEVFDEEEEEEFDLDEEF